MFEPIQIEYRGGPMCGAVEQYKLVDAICVESGSYIHVYIQGEQSKPGKPWPYIHEAGYRNLDEIKQKHPDMDYFEADDGE